MHAYWRRPALEGQVGRIRLSIPKYVDAISALDDAERHCEALRHW